MDVPEDLLDKAADVHRSLKSSRDADHLTEIIAQALLAERLAQRERDAKIAESEIGYMASDDWDSSAQKIASLIRQS